MRHPETVGALLGGEHPVKETIAVALEHVADALHIDQIAAETDQHAAGRKGKVHDGVESSGKQGAGSE